MPHLYLQGASLICANPFFRPACFSDHFCEYSFKHDRLHSVPSKPFSILISILFFFIIIAAKRRHPIVCQNSPRSISPKTVTKELGSSIWNKET